MKQSRGYSGNWLQYTLVSFDSCFSNTAVVIEDTQVSSEQQQRNSDYDIATFMEKFRSSLELIEKRF